MKNISKLVALVLCFVMVLALGSVAFADEAEYGETLGKVMKEGKIIMGVNATYAPFEFHKEINGKDTILGFDIDLGQAIADELGVEFEIVDMSFDGLLPALATGKVDFLPGLSYSEERAQNASFTRAYHKSEQVVVMRNDDADASSAEDSLAGKTIGVLKGSAQERYLANHYPEAKPYSVASIPNLIAALKTGKVDGVQLDYVVAALYDVSNDDIKMSNVRYTLSDEEDTGSCILVRKDNNEDLIEIMNTVLNRVIENGELQQWEDDVIALMDVGDLPS